MSSPAAAAVQVLVVGRTNASLFNDILDFLRNVQPALAVHVVRNVREVAATAAAIDMVIVLQQWPDEYTTAEALHLIDAAPLARLIVCYGPWCDSDGRSSNRWPHSVRVPVASAVCQVRDELDRLARGRPPLPLTADRNLVYVDRYSPAEYSSSRGLQIRVVCHDAVLSDTVGDLLTAAGHSLVHESDEWADAIVWDADPWNDVSRNELNDLRQQFPLSPLLALCGFPRWHHASTLNKGEVAALVPKLAAHAELVAAIVAAAETVPANRRSPGSDRS
ncbi:MAG: hypothetical protein KF861_05355 [Planctomycetaceae bacterium]|nr:hypothetical protein [Planctomycetaceae bacterium]